MSLTLFSWLLAIAALFSFGFMLFALGRRNIAGALPFALTLLGEFIWSAGYWQELNAPDLAGKLLWDNLQFLGTDLGVAGALAFALAYTGHELWLRRAGPLLAIFPALSLLVVWAPPLSGLVRSDSKLVMAGGELFLSYTYGPWMWILVAYSFALTSATLGLLIAFAAQSPGYRQPALAFVVGFSAPVIGSLLTVLGLIPIHGLERLDISAITFTFTIPLMSWALFRKRMLDIVPIARTLMVDQMRNAVLVLDVQGRVVDVNPSAGALLGQAGGALIGVPGSQLLPAIDRLTGAEHAGGPIDLRLPERPQRDIEASVTPLHSRRGRQIGWLFVLRDVTAQRQQARYQRTLASCSQILLRSGHTADETSQALGQVLGLLRQAARARRIDLCRGAVADDGALQTWPMAEERSTEVMPFPLEGCLPWERLPAQSAAMQRGQELHGPVQQIFADDSALAQRLADGGAPSLLLLPLADADGLWGILRGCADRPEHSWDMATIEFLRAAADMIAVSMRQWASAIALIQARDAAESANRAKNAFLSTMSHELRTPLTAIIGYSQLLELQLSVGNYTSIGADLEHINVASQHLLSLINSVLDLSRIESGSLSLQRDPVDLADLIRSLDAHARELAAQNNNTFELSCPPTLAVAHTDASRLREVLVHLLDNAAKFTKGGAIRLSAAVEQIDGADWAIFKVADTGIGIADDQLHRLFLPFSQLDDSLNRRYGGSGIGLALSRRLCHLLGGSIAVESSLGEGATFTVRLPITIRSAA